MFQELMNALGYPFKDLNLLKAALTHRSVQGGNNERLEFLGDSILNFIIAEALCDRYPTLKEGELSRLRASLVKGEALADLAHELKLYDYLRLGIGELKTGGAQRKSILADAMEAVIAAIYMDGGFIACRERVLSWYASRLAKTEPGNDLKDPKTQLQEYLQSKKQGLPQYIVSNIEGEAHAQTFYVECRVPGISYQSIGVGTSRRRAEQEAARDFLTGLATHIVLKACKKN